MRYTEEDVAPFIDGLREVCPVKLQELEDELKMRLQRRKNYFKQAEKLRKLGGKNQWMEYILINLGELEGAEIKEIQQKMEKWIRLSDLCKPKEERYQEPVVVGRYSQDEIEKARQVPIENFYHGQLRGNVTLTGRCPFHEERTPSFIIDTRDNHYHCYGCQAHGSVIDYLMKTRQITFKQAIEALL